MRVSNKFFCHLVTDTAHTVIGNQLRRTFNCRALLTVIALLITVFRSQCHDVLNSVVKMISPGKAFSESKKLRLAPPDLLKIINSRVSSSSYIFSPNHPDVSMGSFCTTSAKAKRKRNILQVIRQITGSTGLNEPIEGRREKEK